MHGNVDEFHLVEGSNSSLKAQRLDLPLVVEWAERYHPQEGISIWRPMLPIDMEEPRSYGDALEREEDLERVPWNHTPVWELDGTHPAYEQARKEIYQIFNYYCGHVEKKSIQDSWRGRLAENGYTGFREGD